MHIENIEHNSLKSVELKKHVAVIHSNSNISLLQRKISNALLFHAYDTLLIKNEHEIHISELTKLIGYDSNDHKKIKQSLVDLLATVIEWNIVDGEKIDKENIWNASSIISDVSIQGSTCTYSYSNKMRQLLYHPSVYGRLNMHVQAKFQSSYGLALYENCNRYQDIGQTPWFDLNKFRKLMGVEEEKYKIFRDFKVRVLNKSVEEVNKYSSLVVEPKLKKQNRQVVAIQFIIKGAESINGISKKSLMVGDSLPEILKNKFGLSGKQIIDVLEKYEEIYINEKIALVENSSSYVSGKIKNLGKYFLCALTDDYQVVKKSNIKDQAKNKKENEHKRGLYELYVRMEILQALKDEADSYNIVFLEKFKQYIEKTIFSPFYEKEGLKNVLVQDQLVKFVLSSDNRVSKQINSYDQWSERGKSST